MTRPGNSRHSVNEFLPALPNLVCSHESRPNVGRLLSLSGCALQATTPPAGQEAHAMSIDRKDIAPLIVTVGLGMMMLWAFTRAV
jgi:hypothetical protein